MANNNERSEQFDFGSRIVVPTRESPVFVSQRGQLEYPLDAESEGTLKISLKRLIPELNRVQALTIPAGATSFDIANSDAMKLTGAAAVTIATIVGGYDGQKLTLIFTDGNITITDDATANRNTVNLSAAFTSTANDVLQLIYDGVSWFEVSRSTN